VVDALSALIYGGDNFVAKKLAELLVSRGLTVFWDDDEVKKPLYFFDFGPAAAGSTRYQEMIEKKVKICQVNLNKIADGDCRAVNLHNVYGEGMDTDWFLGQAVDLAARNKNLILPAYGEKFRVLAVDDAVEALMRAVIISGTSGKTFEIAGSEIESKEVAEALIDLAKMTKREIKENGLNLPQPSFDKEGEERAFEVSAKALRWKPVVEFREGITPVVAEFVARVDEEARRGKNSKLQIEEEQIYEKPRYMVKAEIEVESNPSVPAEPEHLPKISRGQEKELVVEEEEEVMEVEPSVGKKIEWDKVEPIKNNYELRINNYELKEDPIVVKKNDEPKTEVKIEKPKIKINFPWKGVGMFFGIIFLIIVLFFSYLVWGVAGVALNLKKPIKLIETKKIDEAEKLIEKYKKQNNSVTWFWQNTKLGELQKISNEILDIETKACLLAESMEKVNGAVFEEKIIDFKIELLKISSNLQDIETRVGVVQARLTGVKQWIPGRWKPEVESALTLISNNIDLVRKLRQVTSVLPEILGLDGKRRDYLVLLQNEMEIRANGGFIGSYGILSFEGGRLLSFDIKDIYDADGQLQGHVEPPPEIKRYLGEAAWFMRDSNWKASFPESVKDVQWFFEKETGRKVDGVIGIDLAVVKSILGATGEIFVPDFKEKVNKDNLYEQAEFYSETKFFPGSVQKASFLGGMGKQLFEEVAKLPTLKRWNLLVGLADVLERNDLQIVLNNVEANQTINDLGWDGEVFEGSCGLTNCYSDYLYVVESNLGVNKANYFLYRSMEQKIDLKESSLERTLRINYENMAKNTNWPGGDYKNYLRIYLPVDVQVSEVSITTGGAKQVVALDQVKMTNIYNKRELGFLALVPITKKVVVEVKYSSKFDQMKDKFSYLLYIQRQPGFGDTGMVNLVSIPAGMQPMQVTPEASVVGGKLLFNQKLDKDIKMGVEISR